MNKIISIFLFFLLVGCGNFMGGLRRDLDDSDTTAQAGPTVGGAWAERGFLAQDAPESGNQSSLGHSDRSPAAVSPMVDSDPNATSNSSSSYTSASEAGDQAPQDVYSANPNVNPQTKRQYKNGNRATAADFIDESQNEGSLWGSDGQTNYYFSKNKIRSVGDIITITAEADLVRDIGVEAKRSLTNREKDVELALAQDRMRSKAMASSDAVSSSAASPARTPAAAPNATPTDAPVAATATPPDVMVPQAGMSDVDVGKSLELKAGDTMMGEIVARYPNGNYKIRGLKRVAYKNGPPRMVSVVGVVQGTDITEADVVPSSKIYEYQIQATRQ